MRPFIWTMIALVASCTKPIYIQADIIPRDYSVKGVIKYWANEYQVDEHTMLALAKCESSFNPQAKSDFNGREYEAHGIYQYHKPTFDRYAKKFLNKEMDYNSSDDQAHLTAEVWKNHPQEKKAWACNAKIKQV
jgi:soluble lytic murein transglycosylase-like protein